jgi:hypothetical protein
MNPEPTPPDPDPDQAALASRDTDWEAWLADRERCEDDEPLELEDEGDYYDDPAELAEIIAEAPELEGRPAPRRHVPVDHPVRTSVHHRAHAVPHVNGTGNRTGRRRAARSDQAANRAASRAAAARTTR